MKTGSLRQEFQFLCANALQTAAGQKIFDAIFPNSAPLPVSYLSLMSKIKLVNMYKALRTVAGME